MFSYLGSNLVYNEIEYFIYMNLWLFSLFFILLIYFILLNSCLLFHCTLYFNHSLIEVLVTLLSIIFLLFIISPALIILLDYDLIFIPSFIIFALGYQWAWNFNIYFWNSFSSYVDQYLIPISLIPITLFAGDFFKVDFFGRSSYYNLNLGLCQINLCYWTYYMLSYLNLMFRDLIIYRNGILFNISSLYNITSRGNNLILSYINMRLITILLRKDRLSSLFSLLAICYSNLNLIISWHELNIKLLILDYYGNMLIDQILVDRLWARSFMNNNCLIIPLYSIIKILLLSFDVIHSLGIYNLGIKIDAIPARVNITQSLRQVFKGEYRGFCFELCGQGHSTMISTILTIPFTLI